MVKRKGPTEKTQIRLMQWQQMDAFFTKAKSSYATVPNGCFFSHKCYNFKKLKVTRSNLVTYQVLINTYHTNKTYPTTFMHSICMFVTNFTEVWKNREDLLFKIQTSLYYFLYSPGRNSLYLPLQLHAPSLLFPNLINCFLR